MFTKNNLLILKVFIIIFLISFQAHARWADYEDADIEKEFYNEEITVNEDGTIERIVEIQEKILKESGRLYAAHYMEYYNSHSSEFSVLEAKTIYRGQEYKLDKDHIEDKPLASAHQGFDQQRQILLAYPKAEIGASIYLKYKMSINKVPIDHFFATMFQFGTGEYWRNSKIKLHSKIPLNMVINDPDQVLKISKDKENNFHYLEINLEKPIYKALVNEPENVIIDKSKLTWVSISSIKKWEELATKLGKDYIKVINQPLPLLLEEIKNSASKIDNEEEKIHKVISNVIDKIQYMSDIRTIAGRFTPQDLNKVVKSQLGDCKDFATLIAAILNKLGFKAQVALVLRGVYLMPYENILPMIGNFNHAIVKVTNKNGKIYWLDPTNAVSQVDGIFPDIARKMSLVLDETQPSYERIPDINSHHAQIIVEKELKIMEKGEIIDTGKIILKGEEAINLTESALYKSEKAVKDIIFYRLTDTYLEEHNKIKMVLPKLTRNVKDIVVNYSYKQPNKMMHTNYGPALIQAYHWLDNIIDIANDHVSDLLIGIPHTFKKHTIIKNATSAQIENLDFNIDTPWVSIERKCKSYDNGTEIMDTIIVHKSIITNNELKSSTYKNLQTALKEKFRAAIIFEKL